MTYHNIITIEPDKRGGKPCIRRMRITVYDVLGWLAAGMSHFDQNLSRKLVTRLADIYPMSSHVQLHGLEEKTDTEDMAVCKGK